MAILITGASRGIGKAIYKEFAKRGYDVVGVCKNSVSEMEQLANEAKAYGVNAIAITGVDIGDYEAVEKNIYEYLKKINIKIDGIINNAGISYVGLIQDMTIQDWNQIIATNLTSVFNTTNLFLSEMIKNQKGQIINISSVWGNVGASMEVAYSASKGGVNSYTLALAKEVAPSGIKVNAIAFGAIDTEMNFHLTKEDKDLLCGEIPMGRMGNVEEAAKLVTDIYETSSYLTGQIITMDGGWI